MAEIQRVSMSVESLQSDSKVDEDDTASDTTEETISQTEDDDHDDEEEEDGDEDEEGDSDSETTITDSGQEDGEDIRDSDNTTITATPTTTASNPKLHPLKLGSNSGSLDSEPIQSPLDIFLSAAEALSNTVPSEVALHDHTYSCPPLDIHGSSGLQLIAAAAAVVSPGLSRSSSTTWNSKQSSLSPHHAAMKAPRGRPPNTQKRSSSTSQRIGPSYLTPTTGSSQNVLLQDLKPTLRGRSRSAPTEKPRPSTLPQKQHPPTIASPLLLKSGTKIYTGPPQPVRGGNGNSPLTYSSRSKDSGGSTLVSLKASSSAATIDTSSNGSEHKTITTPINMSSKVATTITSTNSNNRNKDSGLTGNNPVFELNLGNMALLLAAGNTQQAILLPPSSLFNKHTLAVLHSGSLTDTNGGGTLTVNTASSNKTTPTISIDLSKTSVDSSSIPIVAPLKSSQPGKQTLTLSLTPSVPKLKHSTTSSAIISTQKQPTIITKPVSSSPVVTPAATPTTDDLSNLNLLSNLVAGMSKKPQQQPQQASTSTISTTTATKPPVTNVTVTMAGTTSKPVISKPSPSPSVSSSISNNTIWHKKGGQSDATPSQNSHHPLSLSNTTSQQSLMLYTRSLPLKSSNKGPVEDEDHLEYATRGIDELTRLLGGGTGDSNGLNDHTSSKHPQWSPDELLCNPFTTAVQGTVGNSNCLSSSSLITVSSSTPGGGGGFNHPPNTNVPAALATHSST